MCSIAVADSTEPRKEVLMKIKKRQIISQTVVDQVMTFQQDLVILSAGLMV